MKNEKYEISELLLVAINRVNPHQRAVSRLRVEGVRASKLIESQWPSSYICLRELMDEELIYFSPEENRVYLTEEGARVAGLELWDVNVAPDQSGQFPLFPRHS